MQRTRKYSPQQDPTYRRGADDQLIVYLTRDAGTNLWDCTVYTARYNEIVQLWTRSTEGTLSSKYYGLKAKAKMLKWLRVEIPGRPGGTDLLRAVLPVLRAALVTEDRTERPEQMDPLF
jgi:hypothetical protein